MAFMCLMMLVGAVSANAQVSITADPADGSRVEKLSKVTLTFNGAGDVDYGSKASSVTITSDKGYSAGCTLEYGDDANQMVVTFTEITEEANYTISVPDDAISGSTATISAFDLHYTIGAALPEASLTPAAGEVKWLDVIIFNYPVETTLNADTYNGDKATLTAPDGSKQELNPIFNWQIGNGKYTLGVPRLITEPGEYTLTIPDNLFYYYGENYSKVQIPGGEFKYTVVGGELTKVITTPSVEAPVSNFNAFTIEFPDYATIKKNYTSSVYLYCEGQSGTKTSMSMDYNIGVDGNKLIYTNSYTPIIEPGHYYITFPEACVLLGEEEIPSTPFILEFDIVEPEAVNIVITPGEGDEVNMLNHALISFPDNNDVTINSSSNVYLYRILEGGTENSIAGAYGSSSILKIDDKTYDARFNGLATEDGQYKIVLTKNSFTVGTGFNQEVSVIVTFKALPAPAMEISPVAGAEMDKIQKFTITFPEETIVKVNEKASSKTTTLYIGNELISNGWGGYTNSQAGSTSTYRAVEGTTNSFEFTLSDAAINKGDYLLSIPAGVFLMGEDEHNFSAAFQAVYSATGNGLDKIEAYPADPVPALSQMSITYVNETSLVFQNDYPSLTLYKVSTENSWDDYKEYIGNTGLSIEGNKLNITLGQEYTEAGDYYVDINKWAFFLSDGVTTPTPQKVHWIVDPNAQPSGIENIKAENGNNRIYTINGMEVKAMNKAGIYIINGKKHVVK